MKDMMHKSGMKLALTPEQKNLFLSKFNETDGCWEWTRGKFSGGYGAFHILKKPYGAHVISYMYFVGKIPIGFEVDHLCRNRACVRPDHLEAVTHKTNTLRGENPAAKNARKTRCKRGHLLSGSNVYVYASGKRKCKVCRRKDK